MGDLAQIAAVTAAVCLVTFGVGTAVLRGLHSRSLLLSIVVATLVPLAAVSLAVVVNVRLMFLSSHDSSAVLLALACAVLIAVALAVVLGRAVARSSRDLTVALRDLGRGDPRASGEDAGTATGRPAGPAGPAPAELTALSRELATTRDRLDTAQRRARALEDSRRELVAFMSHDLRTPLAGLRALAEGLEDGVVEDQPGALHQMRLTVDRLNGLVTDLFEVSRLRAGPAPDAAPRSMVSLVELSHDVAGELSAHASRRTVRLSVHTPDDGDRLAVLGNGDELARALTNLVGNAVRHTTPGREVVLEASRREDGRIALAVTDGCGGIDEADLGRVFDLGWRADPGRGPGGVGPAGARDARDTTGRGPAGGTGHHPDEAGAGLGLAIAKGVAEAHQGTIGVVNVPGGCRFALVLPGDPSGA